ncbi:uncharacterized protein PHACADRAFT_188905 [Phanerochaete carnosa HHB-10118-sp]|uniref:Uncharacterized protein n=1 Tax=Phanerochaete carnosa (strain HHB-10118-sp) TaxID=650164 RepID=K5UK03_PHACS|nr:uncharacterized protein PHACADRAFT_188905 [Phanerochaete carnosa HHB-10118-sp]EKM49901.1 hypothetical protein PHACADRAFT_188905 [Phanerochaete carnosa HHB-10118-sp]
MPPAALLGGIAPRKLSPSSATSRTVNLGGSLPEPPEPLRKRVRVDRVESFSTKRVTRSQSSARSVDLGALGASDQTSASGPPVGPPIRNEREIAYSTSHAGPPKPPKSVKALPARAATGSLQADTAAATLNQPPTSDAGTVQVVSPNSSGTGLKPFIHPTLLDECNSITERYRSGKCTK